MKIIAKLAAYFTITGLIVFASGLKVDVVDKKDNSIGREIQRLPQLNTIPYLIKREPSIVLPVYRENMSININLEE